MSRDINGKQGLVFPETIIDRVHAGITPTVPSFDQQLGTVLRPNFKSIPISLGTSTFCPCRFRRWSHAWWCILFEIGTAIFGNEQRYNWICSPFMVLSSQNSVPPLEENMKRCGNDFCQTQLPKCTFAGTTVVLPIWTFDASTLSIDMPFQSMGEITRNNSSGTSSPGYALQLWLLTNLSLMYTKLTPYE